ncbi:galactosyl transferase GMA12/MNN10 family protein [Striga asiatica]|uniref:Galactosyl transferase GMA12/MNN10 family protein n=1 Tax=Striga asiatica TaxID=4170 RepID=A0A5A7R6P4_STRAF|nr:galactosyl transferase GMA12/MNN10 family protein [Striga asiatica]
MGSDGTSSAQKRTSSALPTTVAAENGGAPRAAPASTSALSRGRQIHKSCNNIKITILCGFVTILVLRGTIGLSNLASYEAQAENQHLIEETNRIIAEIRSGKDPDDDDQQQPEEEFPEPNQTASFSLGPEITTWDRDRRLWLRRNPNFPSYINGSPRILLVTGSGPNPCENAVGDHYLLKFLKNKIDYCRIHRIEIVYNMANLDKEMAGYWAKLPLIRRLMLSHPEFEWVWWIDSDALFTDFTFEIPFSKYKDHNMILHGNQDLLFKQQSWVSLNTGIFLLRNCQWSLDLLNAWAPMGPKGHAREESGKILTANLKGRPDFEADDQSALIYLLISQKEKWASKVFIENSYLLHGFWENLVDRYEEMLEKYHPGLGDERWPLVTHFLGCKPCGSEGDYPAERCLKSMEKAFNFADNQVLKLYGFRHKGLVSPNIKRVRNETVAPLVNVDQFAIRSSVHERVITRHV